MGFTAIIISGRLLLRCRNEAVNFPECYDDLGSGV